MNRMFRYLSIPLLILLVGISVSPARALGLGDKASLQAAMQKHIDRNLVDGAFLHLDRESGDVRALHPVTAHPMIMRMGDKFVLCFDFRDGKGKSVEIDFYLARKDRSFVVFHTAVQNRQLLKRLMKAGKVKRAS